MSEFHKAEPRMSSDQVQYVNVDHLPPDQAEPLRNFLVGKGLPMIFEEPAGSVCCHYSDYDQWYTQWISENQAGSRP